MSRELLMLKKSCREKNSGMDIISSNASEEQTSSISQFKLKFTTTGYGSYTLTENQYKQRDLGLRALDVTVLADADRLFFLLVEVS